MKNLIQLVLILLLFTCIDFKLIAQKYYGNEWIKTDKKYLKLKVAEDGIYRVTYEEMVTHGFIQGSTDGSNFQLINFGKEQALFVSDNQFTNGDYIEFYGEKNRIGMDSLLYKDWQKDLFNPEYSFVTDTNVYFLTLAPESINKRYTLTQPDYANINLTPFTYYLHEEKVIYDNTFFKNVANDIRYSYFEPSEGFGGPITANSSLTFNVSNMYINGPAPSLHCRIGNNNQLAKIEIRFNNQLLDTKNNGAKNTLQLYYPLEYSQLSNGNNILNLKNTAGTTDRHRVSVASLIYARTLDFQNKNTFLFTMPADNSPRLLDISAFKSDKQDVFVYDTKSNIKYWTSVTDNQVRVLLNPIQSNTRYYITNSAAIKKVSDISVFIPQTFTDEGTQYLIITNRSLRNNGTDYVQAYADYRNSTQGGGYSTKIIDIQSIYDNFGYGIDRHFYSIKQMSKFLHDNWKELEYVFIIGKGLEYNLIRRPNEVQDKLNKKYFVPTFGYLGSDNMLFSEDNYPDPYFAIGRLAARNADDIKNYLDKIIQNDNISNLPQTIKDKYWLKRVIHLGGGKTTGEQDLIKAGLTRMANIIEDTLYGGDIFSYFKKSSDPILYETSEEINRLFSDGVSFVNFFGHSSAGSWEFPIDNPRNFTNFGRYPFLNALGCYAGNLHADGIGLSESFVLEKGRGSIAFLASTGTAFIPSLSNYGNVFFQRILKTSKERSYGQIIRDIAHEYRNVTSSDLALFSQITYHGDPALKFHDYPGPDYMFDPSTVKTVPSIVQSTQKTFSVQLDLVNLGNYTGDTIHMACYHLLPDGTIIDTVLLQIDQVANRKTITIPLKNYNEQSVGKNTLFVQIDPENRLKEYPLPVAKSNNALNDGRGFEFFVSGAYASTVYPPDFAMINTKDHYILKASTYAVPVKETDFIFQIDTTSYFNSPLLEKGKVASTGGLIEYHPKLDLIADRVYYWRVSPDSIAGEGYRWSQASFAYLPNEDEGWNQSHYFQFLSGNFYTLELNENTDRKFVFGNITSLTQLRNKLWDPDDKPGYSYNNVRFGSITPWNFMDSGIGFIIGDPLLYLSSTANPAGGLYGSYNPTGSQVDGFFFKTNTKKDRDNIIQFLENVVKDDKYLHVFSILKDEKSSYNFDGWEQDSLADGKNIFNVMEGLGAKQFRNLLRDTVPYIFQLEKGHQVLAEILGTSRYDIIQSKIPVHKKTTDGSFSSVIIGKATKWGDVKLNVPTDKFQSSEVSVYSVKDNIETLRDSVAVNGYFSKQINAEDNVRLLLTNHNDSLRVPAQLDYWRIAYEPLPDAAIQFVKNVPDTRTYTLTQGEKIQIQYRVVNVNYVDMDSIRVRYSYTDNENVSQTGYKTLPPLKAGTSIEDRIDFTIGEGKTTEIKLKIEINPDGLQPEINYFNNTLTQQFDIKADNDNPILQLAFDGIQIMDGDIVSSKPEIYVSLYDENNYLPITNPEAFDIRIDTGYNEFYTVDVHHPDVRFVPATSDSRTAKLYFRPTFKDGDYIMMVQGKDVSGNKSGLHPRAVSFKVVTAKSVSNIINYPNPFSRYTQFIFTLTGDVPPDNISITIYTVTGKVVREITREQLGPLHIGPNRTEYRWDGTDEYGEKLANGVYLYKVNVLHKDGSKYDQYANKALDSYFKDGFGKLVIMR